MSDCKEIDDLTKDIQNNITANFRNLKTMNRDKWEELKKRLDRIVYDLNDFMNKHVLPDSQVDAICAKIAVYRKLRNVIS